MCSPVRTIEMTSCEVANDPAFVVQCAVLINTSMGSKDSIFPMEMEYGETEKKSAEQDGIPPHCLLLEPLPCGRVLLNALILLQ